MTSGVNGVLPWRCLHNPQVDSNFMDAVLKAHGYDCSFSPLPNLPIFAAMDGPSDSPANDSGSYRRIRNNIPTHTRNDSQRGPCDAYEGNYP